MSSEDEILISVVEDGEFVEDDVRDDALITSDASLPSTLHISQFDVDVRPRISPWRHSLQQEAPARKGALGSDPATTRDAQLAPAPTSATAELSPATFSSDLSTQTAELALAVTSAQVATVHGPDVQTHDDVKPVMTQAEDTVAEPAFSVPSASTAPRESGQPVSFLFPEHVLQQFSTRLDQALARAAKRTWTAFQLMMRFNVFAVLLQPRLILELALHLPQPQDPCSRCADRSIGRHQCHRKPVLRGAFCPRCGAIFWMRREWEKHVRDCTGLHPRSWSLSYSTFKLSEPVPMLKCGIPKCDRETFIPGVHVLHVLLHCHAHGSRDPSPTRVHIPPIHEWSIGERLIPPRSTVLRLRDAIRFLRANGIEKIPDIDMRYTTTVEYDPQRHRLDINEELDDDALWAQITRDAGVASATVSSPLSDTLEPTLALSPPEFRDDAESLVVEATSSSVEANTTPDQLLSTATSSEEPTTRASSTLPVPDEGAAPTPPAEEGLDTSAAETIRVATSSTTEVMGFAPFRIPRLPPATLMETPASTIQRTSILRERSMTPMRFDSDASRKSRRQSKRHRSESTEAVRHQAGHATTRRSSSSRGPDRKKRSPSDGRQPQTATVAQVVVDATTPAMPPAVAAASAAFEVDVFDEALATVSRESDLTGRDIIGPALVQAERMLRERDAGPRRQARPEPTSTTTTIDGRTPTEHHQEAASTATSPIAVASVGSAMEAPLSPRDDASGSRRGHGMSTWLPRELLIPRPHYGGVLYNARMLKPLARAQIFEYILPKGVLRVQAGTTTTSGFFTPGIYEPRAADANLRLEQIMARLVLHQIRASDGVAWIREGEFVFGSTLRGHPRWWISARDTSALLVLTPFEATPESDVD